MKVANYTENGRRDNKARVFSYGEICNREGVYRFNGYDDPQDLIRIIVIRHNDGTACTLLFNKKTGDLMPFCYDQWPTDTGFLHCDEQVYMDVM